jgi:hypothetical protein
MIQRSSSLTRRLLGVPNDTHETLSIDRLGNATEGMSEMDYEVRCVPNDWQHPKRLLDGQFQPMFDEDFDTACKRWKKGFHAWERRDASYFDFEDTRMFDRGSEYWEYAGDPPDRESCRLAWTDGERTHLQMYDIRSGGIPVSPVMESPEVLARWLSENPDQPGIAATYEVWLAVCHGESTAILTTMGPAGLLL